MNEHPSPSDDDPPSDRFMPPSRRNTPVKTDQLVLAQDVLNAILEIRRVGVKRLVEEMEACEPDLCEFFLEEWTNIHSELSQQRFRARRLKELGERIQIFALTLVRSLRAAQLRLWEDTGEIHTPPASENAATPDAAQAKRPPRPDDRSKAGGLHIELPPKDSGPDPLFRIVYLIDVHAADARNAAARAYQLMVDPASLPPVLQVLDPAGTESIIDLSQP
jgi:hypothetical protein